MLIYLCGAMTIFHKRGEFDKTIKWRQDAKMKLEVVKYNVFDPTYNFDKNLQYNNASIVAQNKHYLHKSDIVLVNLECLEFSPGTMWEIYLAKEKGIPVLAFGENEDIIKQPHVSNAITMSFETSCDAINHIKNMYHLKV